MAVAFPPLDRPFHAAVSLGPDCRPAYQIARDAFRRRSWLNRDKAFRRAYWKGDRRALPMGRFPFDAVTVPMDAIAAYLRTDFAGFFDRDRLTIDALGRVINPEGVTFVHAFSREGERVTPEILEREYETERQKQAHMVGKLRELFVSGLRILYVTRGHDLAAADRFADTLHALHPAHDFVVLSVLEKSNPRGLIVQNERRAVSEIDNVVRKDPIHLWEGDDVEWHKALGPLRLNGDRRIRSHGRWLPSRDLLAR